MEDLILQLDEAEEAWWGQTIKEFRDEVIQEPKFYAKAILEKRGITKEILEDHVDELLSSVREEVWQMYLLDEAEFHKQVLAHLIHTRSVPKSILTKIIDAQILGTDIENLDRDKLLDKFAHIVGEYAGRVMPYIYALSLSTTQSRRSRAGKTFEHIIETFMDYFGIPYGNQSSLGTIFYKENRLGKKVDMIIPGAQQYSQNRSKCAVVTLKTTLRERWQEVAEELQRTNIPHIYLLTADTAITSNVVEVMNQYNIMLVVYSSEKNAKFMQFDNVQDFSTFFKKEMVHIINYWNNKDNV